MKRTFLVTHNGIFSSPSNRWGIGAVAFAVLVLLIRLIAPNFFWHITAPAFSAADTLAQASHTVISSFSNAAALSAENERLRSENSALADENRALSATLANIPAFVRGSVSSGVLADVVVRPPESPYDVLVVAAGTNDGVTVGMEAFGLPGQGLPTGASDTNVGIPIGTVSSVTADFSHVTLFSASGARTEGWLGQTLAGQALDGQTMTPIVVVGSGGGTLSATVPRAANAHVGDIVYVPGPGALPIGMVARLDGDPSAPAVTLRIQSAFNLFSATEVLLRNTGTALTSSFATSTCL